MKKTIITIWIICFGMVSVAQNKIDAALKEPANIQTNNKLSNIASSKSKMVDSLFALRPQKQKTDYEKMVEKRDAELKAFSPKGNEVWVYEDILFNGAKKVLKVGNYNLAALGLFWNDKVSSMLIPEGIDVTVYLNDNFDGPTTTLKGFGLANLQHSTNNSWIGYRTDINVFNDRSENFKDNKGNKVAELNDNISSIKVILR
ncbi:hypothetical protein ACFOWM_07620 [Ferruginibacter yonginensis]|uniref:Uncharacterized protein n=1 Tax=Ferruginibacter yonginensis TaxID=1310416 RepID=A0ABV8QR63_9BACT